MYQTPTRTQQQRRSGGAGAGGNNHVNNMNSNSPTTTTQLTDDRPILELCHIIETTPSDDWVRRILALELLVEQIPALGSLYLHHPAWYNTPKLLYHLSIPIQELMKDPRSTVVRRACLAVTTLFTRCQSDARLLFKDMMMTVLIVQGQTVQTIRNAVTTMIVDAIPQVPCKSIMPFWMERLKDKSPTIRDACSLYLGIALQSWSSLENETYITDEIYYQVGNALIRTLRDPSPNVRQQTKTTLLYMQQAYPIRYDALIHDPLGPAIKDTKLLHWLKSLGNHDYNNNNIPDDLSIASKYTYNSESRFAVTATSTNSTRNNTTTVTTNPIRISSPRLLQLHTNRIPNDIAVTNSNNDEDSSIAHRGSRPTATAGGGTSIPYSIAVTTTSTAGIQPLPPDPPETKSNSTSSSSIGISLGPPLRRTNNNNNITDTKNNKLSVTTSTGRGGIFGTPPRPKLAMFGGAMNSTNNKTVPTTPQAQTYSALALQASQEEEDDDDGENYATNKNNDKDDTEIFDYSESQNSDHPVMIHPEPILDSPFIASMHELKKHASQRRSRNSIVMQERFSKSQQMSSSSSSSIHNSNTNHKNLTPTSSRDDSTTVGEIENQNNSNNNTESTITTPTANNSSSNNNKVVVSTISTTTTTPTYKKKSGVPSTMSQTITTPQPPEHIVIAIQLLRAHKTHVDTIMETLKLEMDTLRDFDALLEQPGRPTEEELITYYESIDLCVLQRYNANVTLRTMMNQLSTGDMTTSTTTTNSNNNNIDT